MRESVDRGVGWGSDGGWGLVVGRRLGGCGRGGVCVFYDVFEEMLERLVVCNWRKSFEDFIYSLYEKSG